MLARLRNEPALLGGLVTAVISLVLAFGVKVSEGQVAAITAVVAAVAAFFVRSQVFGPQTGQPKSPTGG